MAATLLTEVQRLSARTVGPQDGGYRMGFQPGIVLEIITLISGHLETAGDLVAYFAPISQTSFRAYPLSVRLSSRMCT